MGERPQKIQQGNRLGCFVECANVHHNLVGEILNYPIRKVSNDSLREDSHERTYRSRSMSRQEHPSFVRCVSSTKMDFCHLIEREGAGRTTYQFDTGEHPPALLGGDIYEPARKLTTRFFQVCFLQGKDEACVRVAVHQC